MEENNGVSGKPKSTVLQLQSLVSNAWPGDKLIRSSKELLAVSATLQFLVVLRVHF